MKFDYSRHLAAIGLCCLAVTGQPAVAQDAQAPAAAPATPATPAANDVVVELVDAGAAPRHELRFQPTVGEKQTVAMVIKLQIATKVNDQPAPQVALPAQKMTLDVETKEVTAEKDVSLIYKFANLEVVETKETSALAASAMKNALKPLIGATGEAVMTSRGLTKSNHFNVPADASPTLKTTFEGMKDSMNHLSSPFPAEPVGVGGSWKVTQFVTSNGLRLKQVSVHKVKSVDDKGLEMEIEITQSAEPQDLQLPSLPAGTKLHLDSLSSNGKGTNVITFNRLMPLKSSVALTSDSKMSIDAGAIKQKMATNTTVEISVE